MTSSDASPPRRSYFRRILWLAVFVVALFGGYSVAWLYVGNLLESQVKTALADANAKGISADCLNPTARGYPFRIGLYCDTVRFDDRKGLGITAGAFRSAAQVYNPFHIVGELDGPATIDIGGKAALQLDWQSLVASTQLATPLPARLSIGGTDLAAGPVLASPSVNAKSFEGHMRPNGTDLDVAGNFGDLAIDPTILQNRALPPLSGEMDATIANGVALLQSKATSLKGQAATIRTLTLSTDPTTGVGIKGTISADQAGLIDANLLVTLRNPKALADIAAKAFPEAKDKISNAMLGIAALGDSPTLPLRIVKGRASIGFIPLGDVPVL